jgi:hypothetical protein
VDSSLGSIIKNSTLFVSDFDTGPDKLIVTLLQEPKHGNFIIFNEFLDSFLICS